MKESKEIILMVEVVCYNQNNEPVSYYNKFSEPINNASKLEKEKKRVISHYQLHKMVILSPFVLDF